MPLLDHMPETASPVSVSQAGLIRLSGPARAIALDVLRVNSLQTGAYVSHFRGRGMEFDESRPYQPGDDPRSIDWRVTARSTTAYTKLFREERERPVLIVVDLRANMHFATRGNFKSVAASRAAALLSWAAHHRGDRLGGLIFGDTSHRELKPRLGRQAALRYVHELAEHAGIRHVEASYRLRPLLDVAVPAAHVDDVWNGTPAYTGDGVLVGVIGVTVGRDVSVGSGVVVGSGESVG